MSGTVIYEGHAKSPQYRVEFGSIQNETWSSRGGRYTSLEDAKREATLHESRGYDSRIILIAKEVAR